MCHVRSRGEIYTTKASPSSFVHHEHIIIVIGGWKGVCVSVLRTQYQWGSGANLGKC